MIHIRNWTSCIEQMLWIPAYKSGWLTRNRQHIVALDHVIKSIGQLCSSEQLNYINSVVPWQEIVLVEHKELDIFKNNNYILFVW